MKEQKCAVQSFSSLFWFPILLSTEDLVFPSHHSWKIFFSKILSALYFVHIHIMYYSSRLRSLKARLPQVDPLLPQNRTADSPEYEFWSWMLPLTSSMTFKPTQVTEFSMHHSLITHTMGMTLLNSLIIIKFLRLLFEDMRNTQQFPNIPWKHKLLKYSLEWSNSSSVLKLTAWRGTCGSEEAALNLIKKRY